MNSISLFALVAACLLVIAMAWIGSRRRRSRLIRIGRLTWRRVDFTAGWLITGGTGTGKTLSGVVRLMFEVFRTEAKWGGLVIDDKGNFQETVLAMARHFGREQDVIVLKPSESENELPSHRFNLIGDPSIPAETYAQIVLDTAVAMGQRNEQSFFRTQGRDHIAAAIQILRLLAYDVTLENVFHLLLDRRELERTLEDLRKHASPAARLLVRHFEERYLNQPAEQLGGVQGTIGNYLSAYMTPAVAAIFSRDSTFNFGEVDQGRIICLALPQKYSVPRRYAATFLKQLYYHHVLRRYDLPSATRRNENLLVMWADEAQHVLTDSQIGLSDFNAIDRIREVHSTVVLATQSIQSFIPPLGRDKSEVVRLNLRNRLIFQTASETDSNDAAVLLGKQRRFKATRSTGRSGGRTKYTEDDVFRVKPEVFQQLRNHVCVVVRTDKKFHKTVLPPLLPDGKIQSWFPWWRRFLG